MKLLLPLKFSTVLPDMYIAPPIVPELFMKVLAPLKLSTV